MITRKSRFLVIIKSMKHHLRVMNETEILEKSKTSLLFFLWPTGPSTRTFTPFYFTVEPADTLSVRAASVILNCSAYCESSPKIEWKKDGTFLNLVSDDRRQLLPDGSLLINSVVHNKHNKPDEGHYQCVATVESLGTIVSRTAKLTVAGKFLLLSWIFSISTQELILLWNMYLKWQWICTLSSHFGPLPWLTCSCCLLHPETKLLRLLLRLTLELKLLQVNNALNLWGIFWPQSTGDCYLCSGSITPHHLCSGNNYHETEFMATPCARRTLDVHRSLFFKI